MRVKKIILITFFLIGMKSLCDAQNLIDDGCLILADTNIIVTSYYDNTKGNGSQFMKENKTLLNK